MMDDFIGTYGNNLIVAVVGVGVALLALAIILWIIRRRGGSSPFIRGGKNRQPRLQVLDATAVDARRRLVLVRRDNVEHLVMIGGPTDIVIESGIGAIPILRDVRDPQDEMLQSPSSEKAIAQNRTRTLPPVREQELRPSTPVAAAPAPSPEIRPAAVAPVVPTLPPTVATRPVSPPAPAPKEPFAPAAPAVSVAPPAPAAPRSPAQPAQPAPDIAPIPKAIAREPIVPPVTATVVPAMTAASLQAELASKPATPPPAMSQNVQPLQPAVVAPVLTPEPIAVREPVVDQNDAVDFLDAVRERVLPTFRNETPMSATASATKPEPLVPNENGAVFGDQLTSDFESFLQAEIEKNNATEAPDISLEPKQQHAPEPVAPAVSSDPADRDVQKEMARIFGEMAVTRDR